jgi:hypothetical protein
MINWLFFIVTEKRNLMGVLKYSINLSDHLLNTSEDLAIIEGLVKQIRAPMCPGYVSEKYPVNQKILNAMFRHKMSGEWGWEKDPKVDPSIGKGVEGDFAKKLENDLRVFVEVEFGNVASIFRDLFKFIYMKVIESYDVGVLIVPSEKDNFSKEIEGIYSFQGVKKILEKSRGSISVPVLLLGIEPDRNLDIDCYSLEPDWYPNRPLEDGERSPWKSQSDPFWDSFVERHADSLFPDES